MECCVGTSDLKSSFSLRLILCAKVSTTSRVPENWMKNPGQSLKITRHECLLEGFFWGASAKFCKKKIAY